MRESREVREVRVEAPGAQEAREAREVREVREAQEVREVPGKPSQPRPAASAADAIGALDDLVATNLIGRQELARNLDLSVKDLVCFAYVLEADAPVTAGDLAGRAHVTTGAVTGILNRLERGGFVERGPDPTDRRRVLVTAVPSAAERVQAVYGPYATLLTDLCARYSADELAVITDWLTGAAAMARTYLEDSC